MAINGSRLRALRTIHDLDQKELASRCDCRQAQVSDWESQKSDPTAEQLVKLKGILDCTTDYLLGQTFVGVDVPVAASEMALDVYCANVATPSAWKERCRRVLRHADPPLTAANWQILAEQIDLAVGPSTAPEGMRIVGKKRR